MNGWFDTDSRLLDSFRNRVGHLFSDFLEEGRPFLESNGYRVARAFPALNVWEDEENLYAECEIPGVHMEDLEVTVVGRELTLKGQSRPQSVEGATVHRQERDTGAFHRTVQLPVDIDSGKVKAELRQGVLTLTLPKASEARPRKIAVKCVSS